MRLLTRNDLTVRLEELVRNAQSIDVAVAWTTPCRALELLADFGKRTGRLRAIVGLSGNATHPEALERLFETAELRFPRTRAGIFHPKLYIFSDGDRTAVWIGSANLTVAGFQVNEEIVVEVADCRDAMTWFRGAWTTAICATPGLIAEYAGRWVPQPPPPASMLHDPAILQNQISLPVNSFPKSWNTYVASLEAAEAEYARQQNRSGPVLGPDDSWLNTVTLGSPVVRRVDWDHFTQEDRYLLLGRRNYGHLGSMGGAGQANNVFREDTDENVAIRRVIRQALQPVMDANDRDFAASTGEFLRVVTELPRFGGGLATRFIALARPDRGVSVNSASRRALAFLAQLPVNSLQNPPQGGRAASYVDLIRCFEQQEWYSMPTPRNTYEMLLADNRAALFDSLVYEAP